jgi:hypothetical protein
MLCPTLSCSNLYKWAYVGTHMFQISFWWANQKVIKKCHCKTKIWTWKESPQLIIMDHTMSPNHWPSHKPRPKWWQTVLEIEVSCSQWEGSACTPDGPWFFLYGGAGGVIFWIFFLVCNVFPTCFHHVPLKFPKLLPRTFPIAPQIYLIWFAPSI